MRRIELLTSQARRATDNTEYSENTGISDEEFIQYFNDGQERIQSLILQAHSEVFLKEKELDVTVGEVTYDIPTDCFLGTRLEKVEYSRTGEAKDYYQLNQATLASRDDYQAAVPAYYIRRGTNIIINPKPQAAGKLRLTYQKAFPRLDQRRATVSAVTLDTGTNTITSLTFDTTAEIQVTAIQDEGYICIVDKDGDIQMRAIPIDSINESTGVVTLSSGFVFETGETIAVGDFAVLGKDTTTNSELPNIAEKYLLSYCQRKILARDSSGDSAEQDQELERMEADIVSSYAEPDMDVNRIPIITNNSLFISDYF